MPLLAAPAAMTIVANVGVCLWTAVAGIMVADKTVGFTMKRHQARAAREARKAAGVADTGLATA